MSGQSLENTAARPARTARPSTKSFREYAFSMAIALAIALFLRAFVVQAFSIPSSSMENTLEVGDYLLANKFLYGLRLPWSGERVLAIREPARGDVVIFKFPGDRSQDFVKRLVGLPGDEVMVRSKRLYVNGVIAEGERAIHKDPRVLAGSPRDEFGPVRVPEGFYFMMGDNRDESYDSRFWGFVRQEDILGLAVVKYWSFEPGTWKVRWASLGRVIE